MKYAIVSDLHANLDALERILADAARFGAERIVCLGDVVGYGPLPAETLRRIRAAASIVLAGNHDDAVSGRLDAKDFIDLAGDAVSRHREALSRDDLAWLRELPHTATIDGAVLAHGDLTAPTEFRYIDSEDAAAANFAASETSLVFVGHTHVPCIYLTGQSGRIYALGAEDFVLEDGKRYLVNVGSVGYPRESDGGCYSSYVLYDTNERSVRFRRIAFAVGSVLQRGRNSRRRMRIGVLIGWFVVFLAVVGALIANEIIRKNRGEPVVEPILQRTVELNGSARGIRANMKLAPSSPAAILTISFTDAGGRPMPSVAFTGKSSTKKFKIPEGATRALLSVSPAARGQSPVVKEFAPAAE